MAQFDTTSALVNFHMEMRKKDNLLEQLQSQVTSYKAALDSTLKELARTREDFRKLEEDLHHKWLTNEALTTFFNRIVTLSSEVEDVIRKVPS